MRSVLEELYLGKIYPGELIVPKDPEYRQINKRITEIKEKWGKESFGRKL